jgi:uncharacterized protein
MFLETLFPNGWSHYLAGGLVIGAGVSLLFIATGLIGGMSTFYSAVWSYVSKQAFFQQARFTGSRHWRVVYAAGVVLGGALWWFAGGGHSAITHIPVWQLALGGFIAGFGARMGGGCTSGHGICGLASLQVLSLAAVMTFLITAIATAHIVEALGGA